MFEKQLTAPKPGSKKITDLLARQSLQPYLHVRSKLPIDDDKRPSVSCESLVLTIRYKADPQCGVSSSLQWAKI